MRTCRYCEERKGKRPCPALGAVCSRCCGAHRGREIDCPEDCAYLRPACGGTGGALARVQEELVAFAQDEAIAERAAEAFFGSEVEAEPWETPLFLGYLAFGHVDGEGRRAVERFLDARGPELPADQLAALGHLLGVRVSLFEIQEVRRDRGLLLLDLLGDEEVYVHERAATRGLAAGELLFGWVVRLADHYELTGAGCPVPIEAVTAVRDALSSETARLRAALTDARADVLLGRAVPAARRALREVLSELPGLADEPAPCQAVYEAPDPDLVRARLEGHREVRACPGGTRYTWTGAGEGELAIPVELELRTVRLSLTAFSRERLERGKRFVERLLGGAIRHRFDLPRRGPTTPAADTSASVATVPGSSPAAALDAFSQEVARRVAAQAAASRSRRRDERARRRRRASLRAGDRHRLPPLPHEALDAIVPGFGATARKEAERLRRTAASEDPPNLSPEELADLAGVREFLVETGVRDLRRGKPREAAYADVDFLAHHLYYALHHELHRRKTFWVDGSLAWMLLRTDLDVPGACLELPFPCCAFAFADEGTLALAESLLLSEPDCRCRGRPLELVTVYVLRAPLSPAAASAGAVSLHLCLLFDDGSDDWPYLLTRDLFVLPESRLDAILDSHLPDVRVGELDPVFLAPEMKKLIHLVLNAVLYSTSAHLSPVLLAPERPATRRRKRSGGGAVSGPSEPLRSRESVFFLPGRIDVGQVRQLQELERDESGRRLMKRFQVRGHWRRSSPRYKEQRLLWVRPHWKGPDLAAVVEREYRLRP